MKNTVSIDLYNASSFIYKQGSISVFDVRRDIDKHDLYSAYIKLKFILTASIEISRSTSTDEILSIITAKTYSDLELDSTRQYKIAYIQSPQNGANYVYNVFVADEQTIKEQFSTVAENTGHIDYILPEPLLYNALYKNKILAPKGAECFINLGRDDAFISVYQDGELMSVRPLRYTLDFIKDKYDSQIGERLSENTFFEKFNARNLSNDVLDQILNECFSYIAEVVDGLSRLLNISISHAYLDCNDAKDWLCEFAKNFLQISPLKTGINHKDENFNNAHAMLIQGGFYEYEDEINFTIYEKAKPLYQRKSGQFFLSLITASVLAFAYPAYNYLAAYIYQNLSINLEQQTNENSKKASEYRQELSNLSFKEKNLIKVLSESENLLRNKEQYLDKIINIKDTYVMKSALLYDIGTFVSNSGTKLKSFYQDEKSLNLQLNSDDEQKLTSLLKVLSQSYNANTKQIRQSLNGFDCNITLEIQ
ncbi:MAG: hypothetical protein K5978_04725 [Campylobacter sp.]|nr:hypothetical protein [Campylobacter sp.]